MTQQTFLSTEDLRAFVTQLVGTRPWRSRAGNGTGSIFTLEFGEPLPTDANQGAFSLMVYCAWRIVREDQVLLSWHDDSDAFLAPGLKALEGLTVAAVELSAWRDLTIRFADGQALHILNELSPHRDWDCSWFVIHQNRQIYGVQPDNAIVLEPVGRNS
ncbi:hypothetical protein [Hymenobacter jeollabukensis]|uniref:Uncharacterized protein n=1 Tax=Hymenobacter jeollabukensis TaxID=2025313 RepID=A0A5R8WVI1_9BACT|nr:hypothetical protein [Hymenobacter jeollabukensis]TLM96508.1 hypothetical protein FDY95_00480 [Hymenobacter jeollabukensis]